MFLKIFININLFRHYCLFPQLLLPVSDMAKDLEERGKGKRKREECVYGERGRGGDEEGEREADL